MNIKTIATHTEFSQAISKGIALIDFHAPWCGPCRLQEPILELITDRFSGKILVGSVNIDQQPAFAQKLGISSIPTLIIFKNKKEIQRFVGIQSESVLTKALTKATDLKLKE